MAKLALLTCLASTLFMTGVIWFVQVVHYPLFDRVESSAFPRYHAEHTRATTYVVVLPMCLELIASVALVVGRRPYGTDPWMAWVGLGCALISWGSTFLLSVPAHDRLAMGFDAEVHRSLVRTNGIRAASWTVHSLLLLWMTARALR